MDNYEKLEEELKETKVYAFYFRKEENLCVIVIEFI